MARLFQSGIVSRFAGGHGVTGRVTRCCEGQARRGFTLVEMLVVIAIIGLLIAILFPALQSVREVARRVQCSNQLKQVSLGMQNYHSAYGHFPIGQMPRIDERAAGLSPWRRDCWYYSVLPFVEQRDLADAYNMHVEGPHSGVWSYTNVPHKNVVVNTFVCPSQPHGAKVENASAAANQQGFHGNYVMNAGNTYFNSGGGSSNNYQASTTLNGVFRAWNAVSAPSIRDGTSNTLLASELILVPDEPIGAGEFLQDVRGRYHNTVHAGAFFSTRYPPNTSEPDRFNYCLSGKLKVAPCTTTATDVIVSARSYHPTGVVTSRADGSVHFLFDAIDVTVYRAMGSRAGGETEVAE